jgi:hypothetical protein
MQSNIGPTHLSSPLIARANAEKGQSVGRQGTKAQPPFVRSQGSRQPSINSRERSEHPRHPTDSKAVPKVAPPRPMPSTGAVAQPLAKHCGIIVPTPATTQQAERRQTRHDQQDALWRDSALPRVRRCGKYIARNANGVSVRKAEKVGHFAGLQTCGSPWACPVCGPKIRHARSQELDRAMSQWQKAHPGGSVLLLTSTLPHSKHDRLAPLMETITAGFLRMVAGRGWAKDKAAFDIVGSVKAWDVTVGENSWHPHCHTMMFSTRALTPDEVQEFEGRLHARWASAIARRGHKAPTRENGTRLEVARSPEDVARYVNKIIDEDKRPTRAAMEMTRSDLKKGRNGGRTPQQVLADYIATGDCDDLALWNEYELATRGRHTIRYSKGFRKMLDLGPALTDEEIVEQEIGGETVYEFSPEEWQAVVSARGAKAHILTLAEQDEGGAEAIRIYVQSLLQRWQMHRHITAAAPEMVH